MAIFPEIASGGGAGGGGDMNKSTYNPNETGIVEVSVGGTGGANASDARNSLGAQGASSVLTGFAAMSSTGIVAKTGSDTFANRTITAGSSDITVTNGNGVSGNPTITEAATVYLTTDSKTVSGAKTFSNASGFKTDTLTENTGSAGVTIDSVLHKDGVVTFPETSAPSTPASGKLALYAKDAGGVSKLFFKNDDGTEYSASRSPTEIYALSNLLNIGHIVPTVTTPGTAGICAGASLVSLGTGSTTQQYSTSGTYGRLRTGASTGDYRGYSFDTTSTTGTKTIFIATIALNRNTNIRMFCGLSDTAFVSTDASSANHAGFRYSTNASDTNMMAINGSGSTTVTSLGAANTSFDTDTEPVTCVMEFVSSSSLKYYVYDATGAQLGSTVTHTTNIPATSVGLFPYIYVETRTGSSADIFFFGITVCNRGYYMTTLPI